MTVWYGDALWTRLTGQQVDGRLRMCGLAITRWGCAGKVVSFIGGTTVILDLLGTERLRKITSFDADFYPYAFGTWPRSTPMS